jgi:hypothetical protein
MFINKDYRTCCFIKIKFKVKIRHGGAKYKTQQCNAVKQNFVISNKVKTHSDYPHHKNYILGLTGDMFRHKGAII